MLRKGGFFMQNKDKLTLHTALRPEGENQPAVRDTPERTMEKKPRVKKVRTSRPSASERLFRNTAVACGLLLTVMALKNIDTPVTNKITGAVKSVVSMDLQFPASVGNLSFVQKFMPESALVFLNMTNTEQKAMPVKGEIVHPYSEKQPWTEYRTDAGALVYSMSDGKAEACVQTEEGDITILIKDSDGHEYVYAFLEKALVKTGDEVKSGMQIGEAGSDENARLYFEVRSNGAPVDPKTISGK